MQQKECSQCKRWTNSPDGLCNICVIESHGIPIEHEGLPDLYTFSYVSISELAKWLRGNKE